jgi:kynurenine formamidase
MDKRQHSRISVEPQCKAKFQLGGQSFNNITVANLGAEGCCIQIPGKDVSGLKDLATLESWELIHPSLPKATIKAKVVWCRGQDRAKGPYWETGVQFRDMSSDYTRDLDRYVTTLSRSNPPTFM